MENRDATGAAESYAYDPAGRQTRVTDRNAAIRNAWYDERGLLVKEQDTSGGLTNRAYDAAGRLVAMVDPNWQNPCVLAGATGGTYIFWPRAMVALLQEADRKVVFEIKVEVAGLEGLSHYIEIISAPEPSTRLDFSLQRVSKVPDLFLFPEGQADEDE